MMDMFWGYRDGVLWYGMGPNKFEFNVSVL